MELSMTPIDKLMEFNVIIGRADFAGAVEDIEEALVGASLSECPERTSW
jgi:adenosine/AMP kinase